MSMYYDADSNCYILEGEQHDEAYKECHRYRISTTRSAAIHNNSHYEDRAQAKAIILEDFVVPVNDDMLSGVANEPNARNWYKKQKPHIKLNHISLMISAEDEELCDAPDDLAIDPTLRPELQRGRVEYKCTKRETLTPGIRPTWTYQTKTGMGIGRSNWCDIVCYSTTNEDEEKRGWIKRLWFIPYEWNTVVYPTLKTFYKDEILPEFKKRGVAFKSIKELMEKYGKKNSSSSTSSSAEVERASLEELKFKT
jgi:hypothetical protein